MGGSVIMRRIPSPFRVGWLRQYCGVVLPFVLPQVLCHVRCCRIAEFS